ncbi:MAG: NfeD family protein [Herminiimonas sp.]|nr:NfeD family protein [Herminiimonas sp.]
MENWMTWFLIAGVMVVLEIFTGTFYLLMVAVGFAAGGLAALAGIGLSSQLMIASAVGVVATEMLRRSRLGTRDSGDAGRDRNVNLDIGQTVRIDQWQPSGGRLTARVMYRGAMWDVELEQNTMAQTDNYIIREMRGSRLIVAAEPTDNKPHREKT